MSGTGKGGRLAASPAMGARMRALRQDAERIADRQRRDAEASEAKALKAGLDQTERLAKARGEDTARTADGGLEVSSRDGLTWLAGRSRIWPIHVAAGLRFRQDYERANGTGVRSGLADMATGGPRNYGPARGPTEAMLTARDAVRSALAALGTPILEKYAVLVAGEGRMLSDPAFTAGDPTKAREHHLACLAALDLLARHYGMVA